MADNIYRGKILTSAVIILETILIFVNIICSFLNIDGRFAFNGYLLMYVLMVGINTVTLILLDRIKDIGELTDAQLYRMETAALIYITLMMTWGSVVALMDQRLYGHLMAFMVNMITCSILFLADNKNILQPYIISLVVLMVGLPYYQDSHDVLVGHYVNLFVFVLISWIASRIIFHNYCNDYQSSVLLRRSKDLLKKEIEEKQSINVQLNIANNQLKKLALIDELTGLSNRRSFRNYIEMAFENYGGEELRFSVLMVDIDFFKQFNDRYGHEEGDKVLVAVANQISAVVKSHDEFVGRWGGEEFIYTVFNATEDHVSRVADTIRENVLSLNIQNGFPSTDEYLSVSIGIGTVKVENEQDVRKCIRLADKYLYQAKSCGRNCIKGPGSDYYSSHNKFIYKMESDEKSEIDGIS